MIGTGLWSVLHANLHAVADREPPFLHVLLLGPRLLIVIFTVIFTGAPLARREEIEMVDL